MSINSTGAIGLSYSSVAPMLEWHMNKCIRAFVGADWALTNVKCDCILYFKARTRYTSTREL
jgi:hypothetical protein